MTAPDERLTFDIVAQDRASRDFDKVGDAAVRAGKDFDRASDGAGHLQLQIDDTTRTLRHLGDEFDRTGDRGLLRDIGRERRTLSGLQKLRKEMAGFADTVGDAGRATRMGLLDTLGALPSQLKGAVILAAAGLVAAAAPAIGAIVGGAILAGISTAGIGAGIALAFQDPKVKEAASSVGEQIKNAFTRSSTNFIGPTIDALHVLGDAAEDVADELRGVFADLAPEVVPLARAFGDLARNAMPGFKDAIEAARPALHALERALPEIGDALSDMFSSIAEEGDGAVLGFIALLDGLVTGIRFTGDAVQWLSDKFERMIILGAAVSGAMEDTFGWVPIVGSTLKATNNNYEEWLLILQESKGPSDTAGSAFDRVRTATFESGKAAEEAKPKFEDLLSMWLGLDESGDRVEGAFDDLSESVKENGRSLDRTSEKGRNNRDAFRDVIKAAEAHRLQLIKNGTTTQDANRWFQDTINKLYGQASAAGFDKGKLHELLRKYQDIARQPNITKTIKFRQVFTQEGRAYRAPGGPVFFREGGIHYAQTGLLNMSRRAQMFPGGRTMFGFAEAGTGGEAFVARNAPRQRSLAIGAQAMRWHGASVVPWEQMVRGANRARQSGTVIEIRSGGSRMDDLLVELLRRAVRVRGGDVQVVLGR